jgi:hypothetical protein
MSASKLPGGDRHLGDRVLAPWEPGILHAGTIEVLDDSLALIQFDNGNQGWVRVSQTFDMQLEPGQTVIRRRGAKPLFFFAQV